MSDFLNTIKSTAAGRARLDFFDNLPETPSPRILWMRKMKAEGMLTHNADHCDEDPWMAIVPMEGHKGTIDAIMAEWCRLYDEMDVVGYGQTEIDAMIDCACKNKIKLWNES
jgi:hypothetical protein